jgi:hypothetical protein
MSSFELEVLSADTLSQLDGEGYRPVVQENNFVFRGVGRILRRSSSEEDTDEAVIPRYLGSIESFQFLGFSQRTSVELAQHMRSASLAFDGHMRPGMKEMIDGHFTAHPGPIAMRAEDDWEAAFAALGMSKNTSKALRNPEFADLLLTRSSIGWAKHIAEENLYSLRNADHTIQQNLQADRNRRTTRERRQLGTSEESQPYREPTSASTADIMEPPVQKPGFTMLFQASILSRLQAATGPDADLRNALCVEEMTNKDPCDFSPLDRHSIYTTTDYEVAMRYAVYCKDAYRNTFGVGIITFYVPEAFLADPHQYQGEDWTRMIFGCRGAGKRSDYNWIQEQWQKNQKVKVVVGRVCGINDDVLNRDYHTYSHAALKDTRMKFYPSIVGRLASQTVLSKKPLKEFAELCYPSDRWIITEIPRWLRHNTADMYR